MTPDLRKKILIWTFSVVASASLGFFFWEQLKVENQVDDLKAFCGRLKTQSTLEDIQLAAAFNPGFRVILLEPGPDGNQIGNIYIEGIDRGGCGITLMRGRLSSKAFSYGFSQDPNKPREKLKPW